MATSGTYTRDVIPGIKMVTEWTLLSQDVYNNRSYVSATLKLVSDGTASISGAGTRQVRLYAGNVSASPVVSIDVASGKTVVLHKISKATISHDTDGTVSNTGRIISSEVEFGTVNGVSVGKISIGALMDIPQILRPVAISVSGTTLGEQSTIGVSRYVDTLTHTITWSCGSYSGTISEKSKSASEVFTLPVDLSSVNTAGTTVQIKFTATTYDGDAETGTRTYNIAYNIPASVAPSCTFTIADALLSKYGAHVQNKSTLRIVTTPTIAYDSPIVAYRVDVDGAVYTDADITTAAIMTAGQITVTVNVTDGRGRTGTSVKTITVLAYTPPAVVKFAADRVNADGSDNEQGDHIKAAFSAAVTPLSNKNSAVYKLEYKKTANLGYTELDVSNQNGVYTPTDISRIFAADTGSSYDVRLTITDDFHTTVYAGKAQSGFTIFHVPASGHGFSFGKVSEIEGLFDVAFLARFLGGFMQPELAAGTDFDDVTVPNTYAGLDAATAGYLNCPITAGAFTLVVRTAGNGGVIQTIITCDSVSPSLKVRCSTDDAWSAWADIGGGGSGTSSASRFNSAGSTFESAMIGRLY